MTDPVSSSMIGISYPLPMDELPSDPTVVVDISSEPADSPVARTSSCSERVFANKAWIIFAAKVTGVVAVTAAVVSGFTFLSPDPQIKNNAQICTYSFLALTGISVFTYFIATHEEPIIYRPRITDSDF